MNIVEFFTKWKEGIKNLTPRRQLYSRLIGQIGLICGLSAAFIMMIIRQTWIYVAIFGFIIFIQIIGLIGTRQQYLATVKMEEVLEEKVPEDKEIQEKIINSEQDGVIKNE